MGMGLGHMELCMIRELRRDCDSTIGLRATLYGMGRLVMERATIAEGIVTYRGADAYLRYPSRNQADSVVFTHVTIVLMWIAEIQQIIHSALWVSNATRARITCTLLGERLTELW